jgi:uncharacterized repeat protein (TIGR03803 family)
LRTFLAALAIMSFVNLTTHSQAFATSESILWNFGNGNDGADPFGGLIADKNGNLYGTTYIGGTHFSASDNGGIVFELTPPSTTGGDWTESVLWNFGDGNDGNSAVGTLLMDPSGNLYGTTSQGGASNDGTVFELKAPATTGGEWTESVLWSFGNGKDDGSDPQSNGLIMDASGDLYGTTSKGGTHGQLNVTGFGGGTVFELKPPATPGGDWTESVLWNFGKGKDGDSPFFGLIPDKNGNLYGTTAYGGTFASSANNGGTVFELKPPATAGGDWTESILWNFGKGNDGFAAYTDLIMDSSGNLYGTTFFGGIFGGSPADGTVFKLIAPSTSSGKWTESVLWNFGNGTDGVWPYGGVIADTSGNLYGTTNHDGGTVFELTPPSTIGGDWTESILWGFGSGTDGAGPEAGLLMDISGNLYGTTTEGGTTLSGSDDGGTVFEINPTASGSPTPTPTSTPTPTPTTELTASAELLNFSNVDATKTSKPKKVTLTNKGTFAAQISSVTATAPFTIAGGANTCTGESIAPKKKTCSFYVEFAPTTVGEVSGGSIEVTYNGTSPAIALKGNGIAIKLKKP